MSIERNTHGPVQTFKYKDLPAIQVWGVMNAFDKLGETHEFDAIFEFGTDYGGLSNALAESEVGKYAQIHTFDINGTRFKNYNPDQLHFHNINIYDSWDKIRKLAQTYKDCKILYLCDGGNKKHEFEIVSQWLNKGDCIMVHDYFPDKESFEKSDRWNWWEFDEPANDPTLVKTVDYFDDYVWFFREKV